MSRRRKAAITALFSYGQSIIGMLAGLAVTRVVLAKLGRDQYGLWIASGALIGYAGLADLGVLGLLPWLVAEADGKKNTGAMREVLSDGFAFAVGACVAFLGIAGCLWHFYPGLLHLSGSDRARLALPLLAVILFTAATFPLRTFTALLYGLQDATFLGVVGLAQVLLSATLTLSLAILGYGFFALALGAALPPFVSAAAALWRARTAFTAALREWPAPAFSRLRRLGTDGLGVWLATFGYSMAAASDPVILSYVGLRAGVPSFAISTRLSLTLTQFAWLLPDAGLVGLAQLSTEGSRERVRGVALALLRLNMLVGGAVATAVLASNGAFVRLWVGSDYFLGTRFNALVAANAVLACALHGLATVVSLLGKRLHMGLMLVGNGLLHVAFATYLSRQVGMLGVVEATLLSGALTFLPTAFWLLRSVAGISHREVATNVFGSWLLRYFPIAIAALVLGRYWTGRSLLLVVPGCAVIGVLYLWWMKPLYRDLPLGPRLSRWLRAARLLDPASSE